MKMTVLVAAMLTLAAPAVTTTAPPDSHPQAEAFQQGRTAGVILKNSSITLSGNSLGGKSDGYRMPRPCWFEPGYTAEEMLRLQITTNRNLLPNVPLEQQYRAEEQEYADKLNEQGMWWRPVANWGDPGAAACYSGLGGPVWVPEGTTPPAGITFEQLLQLARAALTVPEPKIKLSPDVDSYVNLPTWVWLDGVETTPRSVTATLPGVMSATVTATPSRLKIDSGTSGERAEVREDCGTTGHPYAQGKDFTCGVRYLRASVDQPRKVYTLTVTSVWDVTGSGTGGDATSLDYAPIEVSATRDVPVGEVQSIVRG